LKSTGNDIVALASVNQERTLQTRFYSQILSVSEQAQYQQSEILKIPFWIYVWLLWSVKESAYKYLKRHQPELEFAPTKTIVSDIGAYTPGAENWEGIDDYESYQGRVSYQSETLYFRSKISADWIVTVVNDTDNFDNIYWGVKEIANSDNASRSSEVRVFLLRKLQTFYPGQLQISKSGIGYPVVLHDGEELPVPVSLAHDGGFVGYSIAPPTP
jgi:phosphopantetheinyl transferase (holo-ACP synthase)